MSRNKISDDEFIKRYGDISEPPTIEQHDNFISDNLIWYDCSGKPFTISSMIMKRDRIVRELKDQPWYTKLFRFLRRGFR